MIKEFWLGSVVALCAAGQASALTVSLLGDGRFTDVEALAGQDSNSDHDAPDFPFAQFDSDITAEAMDFGDVENFVLAPVIPGYGASAFAEATQNTQVTATTIEVAGSAFAEGQHGDQVPFLTEADSGAGGGGGGDFFPGSFEASAQSVLDILFSIDEAAEYDIQAFLSAGTDLALGNIGNDVENSASMSLRNEGTNESVFDHEVSDDSVHIDESGVIGPGTYRFTATAFAAVMGGEMIDLTAGDQDTPVMQNGYVTNAEFGGVGLKLIAADKPIPEPVTTTLAAMGLGALALQTSRRRRA